MRQKSVPVKESAAQVVKNIRRATRRHFSAEDKIRIVLEGRSDEVFADWSRTIRALAQSPNVVVKLGGLGVRVNGLGFDRGVDPPTSEQLATTWRPSMETCIEAFGIERCMFESNFPVAKGSYAYGQFGTRSSGSRGAQARQGGRSCSAGPRDGFMARWTCEPLMDQILPCRDYPRDVRSAPNNCP
jgi:hypothetical protein